MRSRLRRHRLGTRPMVIVVEAAQPPTRTLPATSWGEGVPGAGALITERARPRALRARKERPRINGPALMSPSPRDEVAAGRVRVGGGQDRRVCGRACAGIVSGRRQWASLSKRHSPPPVPSPPLRGGRGSPARARYFKRATHGGG